MWSPVVAIARATVNAAATVMTLPYFKMVSAGRTTGVAAGRSRRSRPGEKVSAAERLEPWPRCLGADTFAVISSLWR